MNFQVTISWILFYSLPFHVVQNMGFCLNRIRGNYLRETMWIKFFFDFFENISIQILNIVSFSGGYKLELSKLHYNVYNICILIMALYVCVYMIFGFYLFVYTWFMDFICLCLHDLWSLFVCVYMIYGFYLFVFTWFMDFICLCLHDLWILLVCVYMIYGVYLFVFTWFMDFICLCVHDLWILFFRKMEKLFNSFHFSFFFRLILLILLFFRIKYICYI